MSFHPQNDASKRPKWYKPEKFYFIISMLKLFAWSDPEPRTGPATGQVLMDFNMTEFDDLN
jgi:hypothetical protein